MKLVYAGTPDFAARCLEALLESRHRVAAVLTRPDRPAGRGLSAAASPVKNLALSRAIPIEQPAALDDPRACDWIARQDPEILVVAAYGLILPQAVLDIPSRGAINVHASLLPRWRGAAPIQRALLAGDAETGISIMQMDSGLDTGPVLLQESSAIHEDDTAGALHDRLAALGGKLLVEALDALESGKLSPTPQPPQGATYASKIEKREAHLNWREPAAEVSRRIRAFNPFPGAASGLRGTEIKVWRCAPAAGGGEPGQVLEVRPDGLRVACGDGALLLTELQRPGGRRLAAADFVRGFPLEAGERFSL